MCVRGAYKGGEETTVVAIPDIPILSRHCHDIETQIHTAVQRFV